MSRVMDYAEEVYGEEYPDISKGEEECMEQIMIMKTRRGLRKNNG